MLCQSVVSLAQILNLSLVIRDQLLSFLFKVCELLLQDSFLRLTTRSEANQALLHFLELAAFGLVLGFRRFFLLKQALGTIFQLSLHLFLINLNPVFVPLDSALVLRLHLGSLCLSELNLLLHQGAVFLEVDVLVVQLVLALVQLRLQFVLLLGDLDLLELILLLQFV